MKSVIATPSVIADLGLRCKTGGEVAYGWADIQPEVCLPGSGVVRTSVLATWADVLAGAVAGLAINPRIPLTLDLEVQLQGLAHAGDKIAVSATVIKAGRTVVVCESSFWDETTGAPIARSIASFIASPDPSHSFDGGFPDLAGMEGQLDQPLAERVGVKILAPGTAQMPRIPDALNATGAIQGGIVILAAEEAAMSLAAGPTVAYSLNMRYLRPFMIGPARAEAEGDCVMSIVHLTDAGTGKLGAVATIRLRDAVPAGGRR